MSWDEQVTQEIPRQTMRELVYGESTGFKAVGPDRPTRPIGAIRKMEVSVPSDALSDGVPEVIGGEDTLASGSGS